MRRTSPTVLAMALSLRYQSIVEGWSPGTTPYGALYPTTPQKVEGIRVDPPMSDPVASGA